MPVSPAVLAAPQAPGREVHPVPETTYRPGNGRIRGKAFRRGKSDASAYVFA